MKHLRYAQYYFKKIIKYLNLMILYFTGGLKPRAMYINITSFCNSNCVYCEVKSLDHSLDLQYDRLTKLVDEAKEQGIKLISLSGGEPFVYPRVWDLIKYILDKGLKIDIVTNGLLLENFDEEKFVILKQLECLNVSLESYKPSIHDKLRGGDGFFVKTVNGIRKTSQNGVRVCVVSVISSQNYNDLPDFVRFVKRIGALSVSFQPLHVWANYSSEEARAEKANLVVAQNDYDLIEKKIREAISVAKHIRINSNLATIAGWVREYFNAQTDLAMGEVWMSKVVKSFKCPEIFNKVFIHSNGDLLPCAMLNPKDNIKNKSLAEALKSLDKMKADIRKGKFPMECNKCSCQMSPNYVFSLATSPLKNWRKFKQFIKDIF